MRGIGISLQELFGKYFYAHPARRINTTNMKPAVRVGIGFGLVSLLLLVGTGLGIGRMAQIKGNLDDMNVNNVQSKLAAEMYLTITERALAMRNLILLTDEDEIHMEIDRIKVQTEKYSAAERKLRSILETLPTTTEEERTKLAQIREVAAASAPYIEAATTLALSGRGKDAYWLLRFKFRPTQTKWWNLLRELIEIEDEHNRMAAAAADSAYGKGRALMLGFGGIALLLSAIAACLMKRAEKKLQSSEQSFRTLAENSPDIIVRFDRECRRVLVNPAYQRETGIPAEAVRNKSPVQLWHKLNVSGPDFEASLKRVMESGVSDSVLLEWKQPDGTLVCHALRIVPEYGLNGEVTGALAIGRNISELKEVERQLRHSHEQLHGLSIHREVVLEEERKSIARELHDELGQILTALHMQISVLRLKFGKNHPALTEHAQTLTRMVDTTMQVVRRVVSSLRPPALDLGIASALEWLADEFRQHSGIECRLHVEEKEIIFDETRAIALFRIVQESLTNVARHAMASAVDIILHRRQTDYFLEVRDNGRGFDPETARPKSFGLAGMRERVHALGGTLTVSSTAGQGTALRVHFPIENTSDRP